MGTGHAERQICNSGSYTISVKSIVVDTLENFEGLESPVILY